MIYTKATFWKETSGAIWHSLSCPGTRDLCMGPCDWPQDRELNERAYRRMVAWAKSHHMTIEDTTGLPAEEAR